MNPEDLREAFAGMDAPGPHPSRAALEAFPLAGSPEVEEHLARCPACRALLTSLPGVRTTSRRPHWKWVAAAALLAGTFLAWHLDPREAPAPPSSTPAALARVGPTRIGEPGRAVAWHSADGLALVVGAGGRIRLANLDGVPPALEHGEIWVEASEPRAISTPAGDVGVEGAAWISVGPIGQDGAGAFLRQADAGEAGFRLAVDRGRAFWRGLALAEGQALEQGKGQALELAEGEALEVAPGEAPRKGTWEAATRARAHAWAREAESRGWTDLLGPSMPRMLDGEVAIAALPSGSLPPSYLMELEARVLGKAAVTTLVFPADGRLPTVDLTPCPEGGLTPCPEGGLTPCPEGGLTPCPEGGWRRVRVQSGSRGTEVTLDDRQVLRLAPGALAGATLREHPLRGPGLILWNGGRLEIRLWRRKALSPDGAEEEPR